MTYIEFLFSILIHIFVFWSGYVYRMVIESRDEIEDERFLKVYK